MTLIIDNCYIELIFVGVKPYYMSKNSINPNKNGDWKSVAMDINGEVIEIDQDSYINYSKTDLFMTTVIYLILLPLIMLVVFITELNILFSVISLIGIIVIFKYCYLNPVKEFNKLENKLIESVTDVIEFVPDES